MTSIQGFMTPDVVTYLFVFWSFFAIPAAVILKKMGHNPAWAILIYLPVLAIIGLWVLAFAPGSKTATS